MSDEDNSVPADEVSFGVHCPCAQGCLPTNPVFAVEGGSLAAWTALIAQGRVGDFTCSGCKCKFDLVVQGDTIGQVHKGHGH